MRTEQIYFPLLTPIDGGFLFLGSSKYGLQNEEEDDIFGVDSMSNYNIEVSSKRGPQGNLGTGGSQDNRKSLQRCSDGKLPPAGFIVGTHQTPMDKWYAVLLFVSFGRFD